jgi:hypothetical protein
MKVKVIAGSDGEHAAWRTPLPIKISGEISTHFPSKSERFINRIVI